MQSNWSMREVVDIGANLGHPSYKKDLPDVLTRAKEAGLFSIFLRTVLFFFLYSSSSNAYNKIVLGNFSTRRGVFHEIFQYRPLVSSSNNRAAGVEPTRVDLQTDSLPTAPYGV